MQKTQARNAEIIALVQSGHYTLQQVALRYGLSKQRVHQIVKSHIKLTKHYIAATPAERTP